MNILFVLWYITFQYLSSNTSSFFSTSYYSYYLSNFLITSVS